MMSATELSRMLEDTVDALLREKVDHKLLSLQADVWPEALWLNFQELGLITALAAEDHGGSGLAFPTICGVWALLGHHAAPAPIGESMIAAALASSAGMDLGSGLTALAIEQPLRSDPAGRLHGRLSGVPWGRHAQSLLVLANTDDGKRLCLVGTRGLSLETQVNIGREPRDAFVLEAVLPTAVSEAVAPPHILHAAVALRTAQMAGALDAALGLTIEHANLRVQFGKPIGKLQAVQQSLALLAAEAAAARMAASMACDALEHLGDADLNVGAAKVRAGEAAGRGAAIAHQIHGAIGFTDEHQLHHLTRRLWSWRGEFGSERYWAGRLGELAFAAGSAGLWPAVTGA